MQVADGSISTVQGAITASVARVTIGDLTSLQLLLGNVLKALTTLSEDVKVLRGDMDSVSTATAKASMDTAQIRRNLADGHPSRSDLDHVVATLQEQHEALALRVAEHQATSSRDREILVQRIAALEVQQKLERVSTINLEERLGKVEQYMSRDGIQLATQVEELAEIQNKQDTETTAKFSQLQQRLLSAERTLENQFNEQCNISATLASRVDQSDHLIQHLEQLMDRDRSSLSGSIQRVAAELARNEGIQAHVSSSLAKLVDAAMDQKLSEMRVDQERLDIATAKKLQHISTIVDVRLEGIKEHVTALGNELTDAKSEVSVFSSTLSQHQSKFHEAISQLESQFDQAKAAAEERWQRLKAAQIERAQDATNQVNAITDDLLKAVHLGQQETERKVKSQVQGTLEKHHYLVLEQLLVQQKDHEERAHSELDAIRQQLEETAGFCRLRLSEQSSQFRSLSSLLFIDLERTPTDPADRLRYLRTLPWCSAPAAHHPATSTPVQLEYANAHGASQLQIASTLQRVDQVSANLHERGIVSQTLGIEVRSTHNASGATIDGVEVVNVVVGGAAYLSGVRVGDTIVAVGEHAVNDANQFAEALRLEASLGKETPRLWLRREGPSTPERRFFA